MILNNKKIKVTNDVFPKWQGSPIVDTYGSKTILDYKGEPVFAEIYALRIFQEAGYQGVWVDTFGRKFRTGMSVPKDVVSLPDDKMKQLSEIHGSKKLRGTWDLLLWKENYIRFIELKRKGKDKIQDTQIDFLEKALLAGYQVCDFEIFEWEIGE